nr:hypothetical protein Q903MT_gene2665 [Picea sitchensis]
MRIVMQPYIIMRLPRNALNPIMILTLFLHPSPSRSRLCHPSTSTPAGICLSAEHTCPR